MNQIKAKGEAELEELRKTYEDTKKSQDEQLQALRNKIQEEEAEANRKLNDLKESNEAKIRELEESQRNEISILNAELEKLKQEGEAQRLTHAELLANQQKEYDDKMKEIREQFEIEKSQITAETQEIEKSKRKAIADLEAETKEWEEKYNNRDARPEDLERIKKLEDLIKERSDAIEKIQQELKHYQSELLNRETTYNKVFNNKPQVGVLNALERKVKRDQMIAQVGSSTKLPPLPDSSDSSRKSARPPS